MLKEFTTFEKILTLFMTAGLAGLFITGKELSIGIFDFIVISAITLLIISKANRFWPYLSNITRVWWIVLIIVVLGTAITSKLVLIKLYDYIVLVAAFLFFMSNNAQYKKIITRITEGQKNPSA